MLTHVDLFSGIGGFALVAEWAGFQTIVFCEKDEYCRRVLRKHWPDVPIIPEIRDFIDGDLKCEEYVQIAKSARSLWERENPIANPAIQREFNYGVNAIKKDEDWSIENGVKKRKKKSSNIMGGSAFVAEKQPQNFLPLTTNSTMEIQREKNIKPEHGNSPSNEDCQMTTKSSVTTAIMPRRIMESVHINEVKIDLLTAGIPCQPASCAGKQKGLADPRWLWPETFAVIQKLKPTWCLLENVRGLLSLGGGMVFENLLVELEALDYEVQPFIIPACAVDAPYRRDRVWIVGYSREQERSRLSDFRGEKISEIRRASQDVADGENADGRRAGRADDIRRGDSEARRCNIGRVGEADWPAEPEFCRMVDEFSKRLDEIRLTTKTPCDTMVSNEYTGGSHGQITKARPGEILSILRKTIGAKKISECTGGYGGFQKKEILQPTLYGKGDDKKEGNTCRLTSASQEISRQKMRAMWDDKKSSNPSQRFQSSKQCPREYSDSLCNLSYKMALAEGEEYRQEEKLFLQDMWQACSEIGYVPTSLSKVPKVWRSLTNQEKDWIAIRIDTGNPFHSEWPGTPRIARGVKDRVNRLRALGNAIVPAVAFEIMRAIREIEENHG